MSPSPAIVALVLTRLEAGAVYQTVPGSFTAKTVLKGRLQWYNHCLSHLFAPKRCLTHFSPAFLEKGYVTRRAPHAEPERGLREQPQSGER